MSRIQAIQQAIAALDRADLGLFKDWLAEQCNDAWDREIAADLAAGRLDWLFSDLDDDNTLPGWF